MKCSLVTAKCSSGRGDPLYRRSLKGTNLSTLRVLIAGGGTGDHIISALAVAREPVAHYDVEVLNSGAGFADNCRLLAHNLHSMGWAGMTSGDRVTKAVERSRESATPLPPLYIFKTLQVII